MNSKKFWNRIMTESFEASNIESIRRRTLAVGKNVTVKASNFNESQQPSTSGSQQVQYQSVNNFKFPQTSIRLGSGSEPGGRRFKSSLPDPSIPPTRPLLDDQRDGHAYRLYACIGAGSSHCEREGSGRRSRRRWWRRIRTSAAAADAK
jgi:hypothetical protein